MSNAIRITRGNKRTVKLRGITDEAGALIPFSGCKVIFSLFSGGKRIFRKEVTSFSGMDDGDADIVLEKTETALWTAGEYYYQVDFEDATSEPYTIDLTGSQKFGDYLTVFDFNV